MSASLSSSSPAFLQVDECRGARNAAARKALNVGHRSVAYRLTFLLSILRRNKPCVHEIARNSPAAKLSDDFQRFTLFDRAARADFFRTSANSTFNAAQ